MLADLKRVRQLLTLATNEGATENESKNAAKQALKIVERLEAGKPTIPKAPPNQWQAGPEQAPFVVDEMFSQAIRDATHTTTGARPVASGAGDTRVKSKAAGVCFVCDQPYSKGSSVVFLRHDRRFCHPDCYHDPTARTAQ